MMSKFSIVTILVFIILMIGLALGRSGDVAPRAGTEYESQGREHLKNESDRHEAYNSDLPTSGPHAAQPANWGVYTSEVPDEKFVHNLEHGGVVITYKPDLATSDVAKLKTIAETISKTGDDKSKKGFKVIMAPRSKNTKPVQLAAWQYAMSLDAVDEAKITNFYRDHLNRAPESSAI